MSCVLALCQEKQIITLQTVVLACLYYIGLKGYTWILICYTLHTWDCHSYKQKHTCSLGHTNSWFQTTSMDCYILVLCILW